MRHIFNKKEQAADDAETKTNKQVRKKNQKTEHMIYFFIGRFPLIKAIMINHCLYLTPKHAPGTYVADHCCYDTAHTTRKNACFKLGYVMWYVCRSWHHHQESTHNISFSTKREIKLALFCVHHPGSSIGNLYYRFGCVKREKWIQSSSIFTLLVMCPEVDKLPYRFGCYKDDDIAYQFQDIKQDYLLMHQRSRYTRLNSR